MKTLFIRFYNKYFRSVFDCSRLYKLDLQKAKVNSYESKSERFEFMIADVGTMGLHETLYENNTEKINIIRNRYTEGNYQCFAYFDKLNGRFAYTRWVCKNQFYSEAMKQQILLKPDELLTLDSYTSPQYRKQGLHKTMNYQMLDWLKQNTDYRYIYMIIMCFMPHLEKIVRKIGYKPVKTVFSKKINQPNNQHC
ncbi:MAG: hypothetical protein GX128_03560 [Bacteroidales bacterium]|jgi:RimJ/RimL family protein N-acetyltransferase|nr:hypothetical protein [Bacteroidales bacterium]